MRLKLYRAACVPEAMALVRAEFGAEALILSTRRTAQGVELTAGIEPPEAAPVAGAPARPAFDYHGVPAPIAHRLTQDSHPHGNLARALGKILRFDSLPVVCSGPPLLVTGSPGAGKTLCIVRLATRMVLAGLSPVVITADGQRAGAAEEMAAYTRLLGLSLIVASAPATLERALRPRPEGAPVLIDTAGVNPFDRAQIAGIAALAGVCAANVVLVAPAGQDALEAGAMREGARYLVATRLDFARRLGGVLAAAVAGGLTLTEAGTGPGATDGITPLTAAFLAERLCRGDQDFRESPRS